MEQNPEVVTIAGMAVTPSDHRRAALREFLAKHTKLNPNRWEKQAGLGEGTLRKYLDGTTKTLTGQTYDKLAIAASELLERSVKLYELQGGDGVVVSLPARPNGHGATSPLERMQKLRDHSVTSLLIWTLAHSMSGQQGAFVLSSEAAVEIPPAEQVAEAKKPFRCKLLDDANAPGYAAGHTVEVSPSVGAVKNDLCIFTDESKVLAGGAPSVAAILRSVTATHWIVTQNAIPGEQELSRETYPQAWPVTVHYPHGI